MRLRHLLATLLCPVALAAQPTRLTIDRLVATPSLTGTSPAAPSWSPDSRTLAFLWNEQGLPVRELWVVGADGTGRRRLVGGTESVSDINWSADGRSIYFLRGGDIWRFATASVPANAQAQRPDDPTAPQRLTTDGGGKSDLALAPDGQALSFLRDGDLWLVATGGGTPRRLTTLAAPAVGHVPLGTYYRRDAEVGTATWGGSAPAYTWSPDARRIAIHVVDRRRVRKVGFPYYLGDSATMNVLRRSYPGDTNEGRRVGLLDVATQRITWLPLANDDAVRVVDMAWSSQGALLVDRESDDAIDRWIHVIPPGDTVPQLAWDDHRATRVYNDIASAWHPDGRRILMTGDLEDRYRLYALTPGDRTPRPLTPASSDVSGHGMAAGARDIIYVANAPSPYERHVWRVGGDGGTPMQLTTAPGHHTPVVSPDGTRLAVLSTDDVTPTELYVGEATRSGSLTRVTISSTAAFRGVPWQRARYVTFPHRTEPRYTLHARIIEPPNMDRSKKYPVLLGPAYSNTVRNRWGGLNGMVQQMMAIEKGYIIVQVDVRGSTGYGRDFREAFLMDWGGKDLDDLESTVAWLKTLPYVDPNRLGIWGSSYGGTLTVYSLLRKPGLFHAGVAGAPATDPAFFGSDDVAIARRPQSHPATFQRGAAQYAANLRDHLLIIHGMEDDVVPFKTTVDLTEALIRAGKDFDVAFAPAATHGWTQRPYYARYLLQKLVDHFDRYLGGGPRP